MTSLSPKELWQSFLDTDPSMFDLMSVMSLEPFCFMAWKEFCKRSPTPSQFWTVFSSSSPNRKLSSLVWKKVDVAHLSNDQLIFIIQKRSTYAVAAWSVLRNRNLSNAELREILSCYGLGFTRLRKRVFIPALALLIGNLQKDDAYLTICNLRSRTLDECLKAAQLMKRFPTDEVLTHVMIYLKDTAGSAAAAKLMELFPDLRTLRLIRRNFPEHRNEATRLLNRKKNKIIAKMERASSDSP